MKTASSKAAFFGVAVALIALMASWSSDSEVSSKTGGPQTASAAAKKSAGNTGQGTAIKAPGFAIKDLSGKTVKWSQFEGKVVLVDFWATWCGPCRRSIPHLSQLHTKYADKGFEVIGISLDQSGVAPVAKFAKDMGMPYTVLMGDIQLAAVWGVGGGIPMAFLIDRQGNIVDRILGYQEQSVFEGKIEKLL